jgi:hypothetical protein
MQNEEEEEEEDEAYEEEEEQEDGKKLTDVQKTFRMKSRKRIKDTVRIMRFSSHSMYNLSEFVVEKPNSSAKGEDTLSEKKGGNEPVWKYVPFETSWIHFEKDPEYEKINMKLEVDYFDVAFSPSLIKMMGFQDYHERFSLIRMKQRMMLRDCLLGKQFPFRMAQVRLLKDKIQGGDIDFYTKSSVRRHELYEKYSMTVTQFYQRLVQLSVQHGYNTVSEMIGKEFVAQDEYKKLVNMVFRNESFSFMDYAVYVVMNETPMSTLILGSRYTSLTPSDLAFVYTNIIVPEVMDDKLVRLLEIMPIRSVADGQVNLLEFSNTHYKTIDVDNISDIKFLIATAYGTPVPFRYGPATVQLHFRRRK